MTKFTELLATHVTERAAEFRHHAANARGAEIKPCSTRDEGAARMARLRFAQALNDCAEIMDRCAAELRDATPTTCAMCGTESPQNEPCTGCGASA